MIVYGRRKLGDLSKDDKSYTEVIKKSPQEHEYQNIGSDSPIELSKIGESKIDEKIPIVHNELSRTESRPFLC